MTGYAGVLAAYRAREFNRVDMQESKFQAFDQWPHIIGTDGLRGCFVVLIGSLHGAILAHIGPMHIEEDMQGVTNLYAARRDAYFANGEVWVVAGQVLGNSPIGDAPERGRTTIVNKLAEIGLANVQRSGYSFHWLAEGDEPSPEFAGKGTVMAGRIEGKTQAWVENRLLFEWQ
ncbi:hypothetical protein DV738_g142, partial [Chaetothyriales sp. CBS 135597]